jgi:hypothetical protein
METSDTPKIAKSRTSLGKRKRGRSKETRRKSIEKEMKGFGLTGGQIPRLAVESLELEILCESLMCF